MDEQRTTEVFPKTLIIIGGGLTGLSAAYYARSEARRLGVPLNIAVIEKGEVLGGKIRTLLRDGFVIEKGPDSFLARKPSMVELAKELGMDKEWLPTGPKAKNNFILHRGKLHLMPEGLVMGIPTKWMPFVKTGLISLPGKFRALMDLWIPPRLEQGDESLGHFLSRRLGKEVSEQIVEPLLSGIYSGDPDLMSINATFPQFKQLELRYGSLIRGFLKNRKGADAPEPSALAGVPQSVFLSFKRGLQSFVERLTDSLREDVEFRTGCGAAELSKGSAGYSIRLDNGETVQADAVICTTPAFAAAKLLKNMADVSHLEHLPYASVANVALAFRNDAGLPKLEGSGFLVPRNENRHITACTWTSVKWPHTAPQGKTLLRVYVGRFGDERHKMLSDKELISLVLKELKDILGLSAEPLFYEITRHERSMPQYPVGHLEKLEHLRNQLRENAPGIWLAGSAYYGVGLPDCVRQGKESAREAVQFLSRAKPGFP